MSILLVFTLLLQPQILAYGQEAAAGIFDDGELFEEEIPGEAVTPTPEIPGEAVTPTPEIPEEAITPTPEIPETITPTPTEIPEITIPSDGSLAGFTVWFFDVDGKENSLGELRADFAGGTREPVQIQMTAKGQGLYAATIPEGDYSTILFQAKKEPEQLTSQPVEEESAGEWADLTEPWNYYGQTIDGRNSVTFAPGTMDTFYYQSGEATGYWGARQEIELGYPSDGSLAGQTLKFVNLYWETDDLGEVEAVFDGGNQDPCAQVMNRLDRGVYETKIPSGDYSSVSFRYEGSDTAFINSSYNIYGNFADQSRNTVSFIPEQNNTFYYDLGETPSYWGADPDYEALSPQEPVKLPIEETLQNPGNDFTGDAGAPEAPGTGIPKDQVSKAPEVTETVPKAGEPAPGQMVYFIDMYGVEQAARGTAKDPYASIERVHIGFLRSGHGTPPDIPSGGSGIDGEAYTMYEKREGIYTAPFPKGVAEYSEIAFMPVGADGNPVLELNRHYNFRGQESLEVEKKWGYFSYEAGKVDAFFLNRSQEESHWGGHPSMADPSLDTKVLYLDVSEKTGNKIQANLDNLWIKWVNMPQGTQAQIDAKEYDPVKGYRVTKKTTNDEVRYFQFPYNSNATENTVLTITFTLTGETTDTKEYTFRMMYVDRGGRNCLFLDNIWEFNGKMFGKFEAVPEGQETRTVYFDNTDTKFDIIKMRTRRKILPDPWKELTEVPPENEVYKEHLYVMDQVSVEKKEVQFQGTVGGKTYYSNWETISTEVSYPCYYAFLTGNASDKAPQGDVAEPGITGYWRSVHSVDTAGDKSMDIPTDTFRKEENVYYANTNFYDYYSNWEMSGRKIKEWPPATEDGYHAQAQTFNEAVEKYYRSATQGWTDTEKKNFKSLYLSSVEANNYKNPFENNNYYWNYGNHVAGVGWNKWTGPGAGPMQGLVQNQLDETICTKDGVPLPFFNEDFLRGNNNLETAVGNVYKNVLFPFSKDNDPHSRTYGYWTFDSARAEDAVRLSYDVDDGFFLKKTGEPLKFRSTLSSFFPFNSKADFQNADNIEGSGNRTRVNEMFGTRFDIAFKLTENAEIYNESQKRQEAIKFEFQGDDDTWIYVDGILALDLGGIHDAVRGEINFQEGTYKIWRNIKEDKGGGYNGPGEICDSGSLDTALIQRLKDRNKEHHMTVFYMERGLYESNLKISFNFPRQDLFSVTKEVDISTEGEDIFAHLLENMGGFPFELKNLVTSGSSLSVEESSGYIKPGATIPLYDETTTPQFKFQEGAGTAIPGENGGYQITQSGNISGPKPEEASLLTITAENGKTLDVSEMEFLRMEMKNTGANDTSASNLYLSFTDQSGKRVGGYAGAIGYDGENNSFVTNEETVIRVDFRQMNGDGGFAWNNVAKMMIGIRKLDEWDSASYEVSSIEFMGKTSENPTPGFAVEDDKISDYGSYESGTLTLVDRAWYMKKTRTGDSYNVGVSRATDQGEFFLADNQMAVFTDKFRTGSYLSLTEKNVDERIFDTSWTVKENGQEVDGNDLLSTRDDIVSVKNPENLLVDNPYPLSHIPGKRNGNSTTVYDGREEIISESWEGKNHFKQPDTETTLVYRGYRDPDDSSNEATDIKVEVTNKLKRGSITITKKLDESMASNGVYPAGDYTFDIYYTDIAGMGLESQLIPDENFYRYVKQTVTVSVGASGTGTAVVSNIPAGTTYYITERPSNGAKLVKLEIGKATGVPHEKVKILNVTGEEGNQDFSKAYATGTAYEGDQEFIFTNTNEAFYMDIQKVWEDGLTDAERKAQFGISKIYIQLQRRTGNTGENGDSLEEAQWENVTKDYFDKVDGSAGAEYLVLHSDNQWKEKSGQPLALNDESGNTYEYRIQEIGSDGKLDHYQVSYQEEESPDSTPGNYRITYKAVNTSVGLQIKKEWDDRNDIAGIRPNKIRVKLVASSDWDPQNPGMQEVLDQENQQQNNHWICYRALSVENPETHTCTKDCFLELKGDEGWKKLITGLPARDQAGKPYYYKLEEEEMCYGENWVSVTLDPYRYEVFYKDPVKPNMDKTATLMVKNTIPLGNIAIIKKGEDETTDLMKGAVFTLERLVEKEGTPDSKLEIDERFQKREGSTSDTGRLVFKDLPYGRYKITETKAPDGYVRLREPIYVTIDEQAFKLQAEQHEGDQEYDPKTKTITITVYNRKYLELPESGGKGTWMFTLTGATLLGAGLFLYGKLLNDRRKTGQHRKK